MRTSAAKYSTGNKGKAKIFWSVVWIFLHSLWSLAWWMSIALSLGQSLQELLVGHHKQCYPYLDTDDNSTYVLTLLRYQQAGLGMGTKQLSHLFSMGRGDETGEMSHTVSSASSYS